MVFEHASLTKSKSLFKYVWKNIGVLFPLPLNELFNVFLKIISIKGIYI